MAKFKRMNPDGTTSDFEVVTPKPKKVPVRNIQKAPEPEEAAKSRLVRRRKPVEEKPVPKLPKASKANFEDEPDIHNDRKYIPEVDPDEIFSYPQEPVRRKKTVTPPATDESAYERTHPQRPRTVRKPEPEYVEKPQYVEKPRRVPVYEDEEYEDEEYEEEYEDDYDEEDFVEEEDDDYDLYEPPQRDPYYSKKRAPRYDEQYFEPVKRPKRNPSVPPKKPIEPKKPSIAKIEKEVVEKIKYEKPYVLDRKGITLLTNTIIEALAQNFVSRDELDLAVERSLQNMVIENDLNQ